MKPFRAWTLRFAGLFKRQSRDRELAAELESHVQLHVDDNLRAGMPPEEARRQALLKLGGIEQTKESYRDRRGLPGLDAFRQDVRFGLRMLRKNPGLTLVAVLTLTLGIGANTAVFSMVNGFLFRPLPVWHPQQITALAIQEYDFPLGSPGFSYPEFADFREQSHSAADVFANVLGFVGLSADDHSDQMAVCYVSANYFSALGVQPLLGSLSALSTQEMPGGESSLVLGYSYWRKRFGANPSVIGKSVRVDGHLATIVGVVPRNFHGMYSIAELDGYLPFNAMTFEDGSSRIWTDRNNRRLLVFARLRDSVTLAQAQSVLDVVSRRLAQQYPASDKGISVRVLPEILARPQPYANTAFRVISGLFLGLAGLVLLLACMNVESILLSRATARRREMGIRGALGADRSRLIRLVLTESFLLALFGGAAGVALGVWTAGLSSSIHLANVPLHLDSVFDWRVFSYAFGAAICCGILVGLVPAAQASHTEITSVLHEGGSRSLASGRRHTRDLLVVLQVAGSLMVLIVAGLFVRGLQQAQGAYLGFDPDHVLNVLLDPNEIGYTTARTNEFYRELEARARALPGVQSVSLAANIPMGSFPSREPVYVENRPLAPGRQPESISFDSVDPGYLVTMHIPLLRGRSFAESDDENAPLVAIINQDMAAHFWPNEDPIGRRFSTRGPTGPFAEVVGVAQDGKYQTITEDRKPYFYLPIAQNYASRRFLQIRSAVAPASLAASVRREILDFDPAMPILDVETMKESLGGALGFFIFRVGALLAGVMGLIGLTLAVVGVYGVVSFAVSLRTREIGIRIALGASKGAVLQSVLRQGLTLVATGILVGLTGAWALTRTMIHSFVGVSPTDPITFAAAVILLSSVALVACWIPARRAMRVDPIVALRHE